MKTSLIFFTILKVLLFGTFTYAKQIPFQLDTLQKIESANIGQPWILVVWSTDCAPCHLELEMIAKLKTQNSQTQNSNSI